MNNGTHFNGRFILPLLALLAFGEVACGAAPDGASGVEQTSSSETPPATGASDELSDTDGGVGALPSNAWSSQEPAGSGGWKAPATGRGVGALPVQGPREQ